MVNKEVKREIFIFKPYECGAIEEYLQKKASEGWVLTSLKGVIFKFKRIKPKKIIFAVKIARFSNITSKDCYEEAGWSHICSNGEIQIYNSVERQEIEHNNKYNPKIYNELFKASIGSIILYVLLAIFFTINLFNTFVKGIEIEYVISSNTMLICELFKGLIVLYSLLEILCFIRWVIQNKSYNNEIKTDKQFREAKIKTKILKVYLALIVFILLPVMVIEYKDNLGLLIISLLLYYIIPISVLVKIRGSLIKKNIPKGTSSLISIFICFLSFIFILGPIGSKVLDKIDTNEKYNLNKNADVSFLSLQDFGYEEKEHAIYRFNKSFIAESTSNFSKDDDVHLSWEILKCKFKWPIDVFMKRQKRFWEDYEKYSQYSSPKVELITSNLSKYINVYNDSFYYYLVGKDKVVKISPIDERDIEEFLQIVYDKCFVN